MAITKFNVVEGLSVGDIVRYDVIDNAANVTANNLTVSANSNLGSISNITITGGTTGYVLRTDGTGNLSWVNPGSAGLAGSNTQLQFNNNGVFGASPNLTFNIGTNVLSVTNLTVSGNVTSGNANLSNLVTTNNIDFGLSSNVDLGNISNLHISGGSPGYVIKTDGNGNLSWGIDTTAAGGTNTQVQFNDGGSLGGNSNFTFDKSTSLLTVTGNINALNADLGNLVAANYFDGNGSLLSSLTGANVTGQVSNALVAGTVYTNAQPNITSVGTLNGLSVSGNTTIAGNLTVSGTTIYANVSTLNVKDPIIEMGGTGNDDPLTSNDGKDRGTLLHYYTTAPVDAFMGWDNSNSEFGFGSNVSVTNEVVTWNSYGNIRAAYFLGNASQLTGTIANANYAAYAGNITIAAQPNITSLGTLTSLNVTSNITSGNANLGNLVTASYFTGNGALLSSITGSNVTGQVGNATVAGTVYTNAQPNITSLGTLSNVTVTGNVDAGNIRSDNLLYANGTPYVFTTNAAGTNTQVQFNDANAFAGSNAFTFNKTTNTLSATNFNVSNITANGLANLGSVTNVKITGGTAGYILSTDGNGNLSWEAAGGSGFVGIIKDNFVGDGVNSSFTLSTTATGEEAVIVNIDGLVQQDSVYTVSGTTLTFTSPPVTGVKIEVTIFGALSISQSNTQILYLSGNSLAGSNNFVFDDTTNTLTVNNVSSIANVSAGNVKTDSLLYANGTPYIFTTNAAGSNTQVQFNDGNSFAGSANFTFDKSTNTLSVTNIIGNGAGITYITGGNVNGQVANALVAGTVYTNAQPNITSLGNLSSLTVTGNATVGNLLVTGNVLGSLIPNANVAYDLGSNNYRWNDLYLSGNSIYLGNVVLTSDDNDITADGNVNASNANLGNLVIANYFSGNGSLLSSITGSNVVGQVSNALVAGTVYTNAQPNITSLGTLSSLSVSGNTTIAGNLTVSGTTVYANVTTLNVKDPIIELGGTGNTDPLSSNDGKDRGTLLHYYTTAPVDAFMGWDNSNGEFGFGSNVSMTNEVVTWNTYGNIRAGYIYGNGAFLTGLPEQYSNANVANYLPTYTGNLTAGNISGANLISANYFQGDGSLLSNLNISNASVANANYAAYAGNVVNATQSNITSLGTLSSLTVTGIITATANGIKVSNIYDSTTTLTIETRYGNNAGDVGIYGNLTVGTSGTGNITAYNANLGNLVIGNYFSGNGSLLSSIAGGNVTGQVGNALIAGTVYTNSQPNITSVGTLSSLTVSGNASFTGSNVYVSNVANLKIPGGSNGYVLKTDGTGNLSWGIDATDYSNTNVAAYLPTYTGVIGGTLSTNAQPNITSVGTLSSLSVTGNVTGGNLLTSGTVIGSTLVSNVATGTAPLTVSSTTRVSNLNVSYSNVTDYANVIEQNTGNYYPVFVNNFANGNYALNVNNAFAVNASTGVLTATGFQSGTGTGGNITGANLVSANYFTGTLTTAAQPNITSLGTLTSLTVLGNASFTGANVFVSNVANLRIPGGSNGYVLKTDGAGNLSWGIDTTDYSNTNVAAYLPTYSGLIGGTLTTAAQPNVTSLGILTTLNVTGNLISGNATLGNLASANYISGNGSLLTSITGGNVTGQVGNALIAGTVYTNAQPNITSLGTLSSLSVTGNVSSGNANLGNLVTANYFAGNGSLLSSITGSNVTGQVGNSLVSGTVYTNAQPNITSLGTLSSLSVTGNVSSGNANLGNAVTANYFLGNGAFLTGLPEAYSNANVANYLPTYTGNFTAGNISATGTIIGAAVTANYVMTTLQNSGNYYPTFVSSSSSGNYALAANANISFDVGNSTLYVPKISSGTGNGGSITGANLISANYFQGDGSLLTNLNIANASVANANYAAYAGNVTVAAQPNITSLGNLSALTVNGNLTAENVDIDGGTLTIDTGIITVASGNAGIFTVGISNTNIGLGGNVTLGSASGNVVIQGNLSVANITTITNLKINDLYSNRTPVAISTGTVIDSFSVTKYRSAKYTMRVNSDDGYQAVEALLIHDGSNSYVTIYGSLSTIGTDIITLSTDVNLGNVRMLASTTSANTTVNLLGTYVAD